MKELICKNCGASNLIYKNGYWVCSYCGSRFYDEKSEEKIFTAPISTSKGTVITLNQDILKLLDKCKSEPWNAKKYANLILDIDPDNQDALSYL